jgi:PKD domain
MKLTPKVIPRAAVLFVLCALALLAPASQASASGEGYGEITRFGLGAPGGAAGYLNDEHRTRLLGVDPTDNSAYVLDEPAEESQAELEIKRGKPGCPPEEEEPEPCEIGVGPITRTFRLQKFAASGGKYSAVAATGFAEEAPTPVDVKAKKNKGPELEQAAQFEEEIGRSRGLSVEGIAVDAALGRVYVLAADYRLPSLPVDNAQVAPPLNERKALLAASTLYAYSTHAQGAALVPAVGGSPVLAGPAALGTQSGAPAQALLEPAGITVDPETHDVIVLAHVDEAGAAQDHLESPSDHFVLQRIHDNGALGPRYTDRSNFFEKEITQELRPHSPVVEGPERKQRVLVGYKRVNQSAGIVEIPDNFESTEVPKVFFTPPGESIVEEWIKSPSQSNGPNINGPLVGGALSASPEGTIFGAGIVKLEEHGAYQGVVELSGANGSIKGWSGGQAQNTEAKPEERYLCTIEPLFYNPSTPIAAGSGGDVFVLAPAYLFDTSLAPGEIELYGPPAAPAVIEFGPGGSGCPRAKSEAGLVPTLRGVPLEGRTVQSGEQVGFSAKLQQGDALTVEWDFGDGTKETVPVVKKPFEPQTKHAFSQGGAHTVTAAIHTDDLATPTVTLTAHVTVEGAGHETEQQRKEREEREARERKEEEEKRAHETEQERKAREERERKEKEEHKGKEERKESGPHALGIAPSPAYLGVPGLFDATPSWDSAGPNELSGYHWKFGDGGEYSGEDPLVFHTYSALGSYVATLTVTDRLGKTSPPDSLPIKVVEQEASAPPSTTAGGGSAGTGAGAVANYKHAVVGVFPDVTLTIASLRASSKGALGLRLYCPAGETTCTGTVKLRAFVVVASRKSKRPRKTLMTLAHGSFTIAGGTKKRVTLHLARSVLVLLAHLRRVQAEVEIAAHDPAGATHSAKLPVLISGAPVARAEHH